MNNKLIAYSRLPSPVGDLRVAWCETGLIEIFFETGKFENARPTAWQFEKETKREIAEQLRAYFAGELFEFDLPLAPSGTPFQMNVWQALCSIPYGETISYAELAVRVGNPKAVRAVGAANGRNPLPIVIPCHRVIGSNGALTGYGGGLHIKEALLALEKCFAHQREESQRMA